MTQQGPNPQTNLIFSIVAPVVALIAVAVIYFTKPVPVAPVAPAAVNVGPAKLPANTVVMANALPNAGSGPGSTTGGPGGPGGGGGMGAPGGSPGKSGKPKGGAMGAN